MPSGKEKLEDNFFHQTVLEQLKFENIPEVQVLRRNLLTGMSIPKVSKLFWYNLCSSATLSLLLLEHNECWQSSITTDLRMEVALFYKETE